MLTLSKHRVGRVQIALRRGAHVENLATFDENSCFCCAKRCERTRTSKTTPKITSEITSGVPPAPPGRPGTAPGEPRGGPPGAPGGAPGVPRSTKVGARSPKTPPGAIFGRFWHTLPQLFCKKQVFARRVCIWGRTQMHTLHTKTPFLRKRCGRVCPKPPLERLGCTKRKQRRLTRRSNDTIRKHQP